MSNSNYPLPVRARLDEPLSRWLWLVKWLLAIPHFIILFFLWIAFFFVAVIAFFAILITAGYPKGLFDLVAGYYRWNNRVSSYWLLMTDAYPPFSLGEPSSLAGPPAQQYPTPQAPQANF